MSNQSILDVIKNPSLSDVLFSNVFTLTVGQETNEIVKVFVLEDHLIFKIRKNNQDAFLRLNFNFDLIFEFIRQGKDKQQDPVSGNPRGFKFERFQRTLILVNQKMGKELIYWRDFFEKKLNQRGFHEIFKPIKKIGKGNSSTVFCVLKHEDGKAYAAKAYAKEAIYYEDKGKQSFANKIEILRKLNHKNLMKLYGVFESNNSIYTIVELLNGGMLQTMIKFGHKFTQSQIKNTMKGILEGLELMHANNILHRNIKPENIFLRNKKEFDFVIISFAIAEYSTQQQYFFPRSGTLGYMAPQILLQEDRNPKYQTICDMFSLGAVFYFLIFKKTLFSSNYYQEKQTIQKNKQCNFNFKSNQYLKLPKSWIDLLERLLEKNPQKRISASQALNHEFFTDYEPIQNIYQNATSPRKNVQQKALQFMENHGDRNRQISEKMQPKSQI